jgi:demethylmenaquinone methyltransferase/2-methoxy-6-polyprenyl-1,4-benzoquinol methylase
MSDDSWHQVRPIPPHPPLSRYYSQNSERERFLQALFDRTAPAYDRINAVASLGMGGWYRRRLLRLAGLTAGMHVLDVAIGTGLLAREAAGLVGRSGIVVGLDASLGMLIQAREHVAIPLVQGRAEQLPMGDGGFDAVTLGYALRHVADLSLAFAEFKRVLRPGGRVLLLEITRPAGRLGSIAAEAYLRRLVPVLARHVTRTPDADLLMSYFWDTIEHCVPADVILHAMAAAGLVDARQIKEFGIFVAYTGRAPAASAMSS